MEEGKCKNCSHGVGYIDGRIYHSGTTPNGIGYTQRLCWIPNCDCQVPEKSMKIQDRIKKLEGVSDAFWTGSDNHLTVFYDKAEQKEQIQNRVISEINWTALDRAVERIDFYLV